MRPNGARVIVVFAVAIVVVTGCDRPVGAKPLWPLVPPDPL